MLIPAKINDPSVVGTLLIGLVALPALAIAGESLTALVTLLATLAAIGLVLEGIGHICHGHDMLKLGNEGASSWYVQITRYGYPWLMRNALLSGAIVAFGSLAAATVFSGPASLTTATLLALWLVSSALTPAAAAISRSLFFMLVIPTTMPGAFFWKNQNFVEHARATGLLDMEQVGVVREQHGKFKMDELIATIKTTTLKEMFTHIKDIVVWKKLPR